MICSRCFLHDMKNAVPAFRFRFSRIDDALILLVESCRNVDGCVSLVLIALYTAVVSAENNLAFVTTSVCRRTFQNECTDRPEFAFLFYAVILKSWSNIHTYYV